MNHKLSRCLLWLLLFTNGISYGYAVVFDDNLLPLCAKLAKNPNDTALQQQYFRHDTIKKMLTGLGKRGKVSFKKIAANKARLHHYINKLEDYRNELPTLTAQASQFIQSSALPEDFTVHLVCGAPADGFGFYINGELTLFFDLPSIDQSFFPSLVRHELWHSAFRTSYPDMAKTYENSVSPLTQLSFIMLNEGVGHYYSFQRKVEPTMVYNNWPERTSAVFDLLAQKAVELTQTQDSQKIADILWTSQAGVPFWKKWGALPGAVITYRLKQSLGTAALAKIISGGPCQFLSSYQQEQQKHPQWQKLPQMLIEHACNLQQPT